LDWIITVETKCLRKTVQQADFKFIDVEEKLAPFRFYTIVYNWLIQRVRVENIIEHEKYSEQNHSIDVLHASIQHPVLVQPCNLALPESDSPKSGIHRGQ
jgi:hypothetical protein